MDIPWNVPLSYGTMGWDRQWDTHASVKGQVDIPWNVPLSHGTVGCDGQSYCPMGPWDGMDSGTHICRGTGGHPMECPIVPWDCGMDNLRRFWTSMFFHLNSYYQNFL